MSRCDVGKGYKMIIDTDKIQELLDSDVTGYAINRVVGIKESTTHRYRSGGAKLENMRLVIAMKYTEFINQQGGEKHATHIR